MRTLDGIVDSDLLESIKSLKGNENRTIAEIVLHLSEIDIRGLYRDAGYSSLFNYCREALGYSEGAAYRRIQAARALKENPEIFELLSSGKLTLCTVSEVSRVIKPENKEALIESSIGKSKSEVQKIAAKYLAPKASLKRESIRAVNTDNNLPLFSSQPETKFNITLEVDQDFMDLVNEAKNVLGSVPLSQVFRKTLQEFIRQRNRAQRSKEQSVVQSTPRTSTRYIPKSTRFEVRQRDSNQYCFMGPNGHRCRETRALQIDHIYPHALGGSNLSSNLRLLCPAHNRLLAERVFGKERITAYRS